MMHNAFHTLGMPVVFDVDANDLEHRYESMHRVLHSAKKERALMQGNESLRSMSLLNESYNRIKNPLTRAQHILEIYGFWPVSDDPDLLDSLLDFQPTKEQAQVRYDQSISSFSCAFHEKNWHDAQKAYWWMVRMHRTLNNG